MLALVLLFALGLLGVAVTAPALAVAPALSNVRVAALGTTSATIAWDTDIASDTQVAYGLTTAYGSQSTLNTAKLTAHTVNLSGLGANRTYHYQVRSRDAAGDLTVSTDRTITTKLGAGTAGTATDSANSHNANVTRFTTVEGGRVVSMSANVGAVDPALAQRSFELAIYTVSGTAPGTLVARSARGTLVANSWNTVPISATLAPNTPYYFAYNTNGASAAVNNLRYSSSGTSGWRTGGQTFGAWPTSFGQFTGQSATFSIQATFASDVTPPTVSLTSPSEGASVTGVVTLTAAASDDSGVSSVQFKVGGTDLGPADTSPPYAASWDTSALLNGPRTITAVATDTAGLTTTSGPVSVRVDNPARVRITSPAAGSTVAGTSVAVDYARSGSWATGDGQHIHLSLDGGPTRMDFDTDGNQSYTFTGVPGGAHTVIALVADTSHVEQPGSGGSVSFTSTAPDASPPTVALTAPTAGSTLANTVSVTADAADDNGVVGVQFLLDGAPLGSEDTSPPYSASWNTTTVANGAHALRARARDQVNETSSAAVDVTVANTDPRAQVGEWGPLRSWPLVAVHATLMRTGEILMWDAWELPNARAKVWNPTTDTFTDVPAAAGLFCAGQATDANGNVIVVGGHDGGQDGIKDVYSFNPDTRAWTRKPDMSYARWYPSLTQMPDGRMLILSGMVTPYNFADTPEIYNPATGISSTVPVSTPELREEQYPQTAVLPNGKVLSISAEHGSVMTFDPGTRAWTRLGTTQVPFGAWTSIAPGKFLVTGGAATVDSYNPSNPVPSTRAAKVLDLTSGSPVWSNAGTLGHARAYHNVTMLPTGEAMVVGGSTVVSDFSSTGTQTAEVWSPETNTWRQVASPARPRMYHSISMLLPDGRVLSAGGGRLAPAPDQLNMQMYSPDYLFKGARPTIASLPGQIEYASTMDLVTPQAADVAKVSMVSLASVTHTADWNQHFVDLPFTRVGGALTVSTPASANLAPPNSYMIFAVDKNGVPSTARIVKLGGTAAGDTEAPTATLTAPSPGGALSGSVTLAATAADNVGVEGVQFLVDGVAVGAEDATSPYSLTWASTSVTNGAHTISAVARDAVGNTTTAAPVNVTVSNAGPGGGGLVAAYAFNEGAGSTFGDSSGTGNGGSVFQATWAAGKYGTALSFDGFNDYASVADAPSLDLRTSLSMEAWVRPTASTNWRTILLKETANDLAYGMYSSSGTNRPSAWIASASSIGPAALPLNTWSHVATTYDGARLKVYVNGALVSDSASAGAAPVSANPLKLGGNAVWGEFFAGQIDEVRLYNTVRTQAQIQTGMNSPL